MLNNMIKINGNSSVAEKAFRKEYPYVYNHLLRFKNKLSERNKAETGIRYEWYALQRCAATYYNEFEKEKIVYAEIVFDSAFYYDNEKYYPEATAFIITGENIKYLTALLNSKLLTYSFRAFYAGGDLRGNTFRYKKIFFKNLPAPKPSNNLRIPFDIFVDYIQYTKEKGQKLQSAYFEQLIDAMVFELYVPEEPKAANKEIIKHMGELKFITDDMIEEEKMAIIQSEFDRLYDPGHPVRNNLETLDSVKEVRIIKEAVA